MLNFRTSTAAEQVAEHLRREILRGVWRGSMPGGDKLAAELGIGCNTAEAALVLLEKEGWLVNRGRRRGRLVATASDRRESSSLRVGFLLSEPANHFLDYIIETRNELGGIGHTTMAAPITMEELGMDVDRIIRMVKRTKADAWVVTAGSSEILDWFAAQEKPAFALFGRRREKRMASAGPDKGPALLAATRQLLALGHRRIVLMTRPRRLFPKPGLVEQMFLDELRSNGLIGAQYHLPHWEETPEGFHARLEQLFDTNPPTALLLDESPLLFAVQQFLSQRGLASPKDVSLFCLDQSPDFAWCYPTIAHIRWESRPLVRRMVRWVENIGKGKIDLRQTDTPAELVSGGTIGPAPLESGMRS